MILPQTCWVFPSCTLTCLRSPSQLFFRGASHSLCSFWFKRRVCSPTNFRGCTVFHCLWAFFRRMGFKLWMTYFPFLEYLPRHYVPRLGRQLLLKHLTATYGHLHFTPAHIPSKYSKILSVGFTMFQTLSCLWEFSCGTSAVCVTDLILFGALCLE